MREMAGTRSRCRCHYVWGRKNCRLWGTATSQPNERSRAEPGLPSSSKSQTQLRLALCNCLSLTRGQQNTGDKGMTVLSQCKFTSLEEQGALDHSGMKDEESLKCLCVCVCVYSQTHN